MRAKGPFLLILSGAWKCARLPCMCIITIPKELAKKGDLVVIPRGEYETLLRLKEIREFQPTRAQKKALARAQRNLKKRRTVSLNEFAKALGLAH